MSSSSSSSSSAAAIPPLPVAHEARARGLFQTTPLLYSPSLSELANRRVYLKLDCFQASGSFKDRGMAHLCYKLQQDDGIQQLISSSGGNAGLAVATLGELLKLDVHVIVPKTTKAMVIAKLESMGAQVTIHGENWNAADVMARALVDHPAGTATATATAAAYISPYDHPLLWTGHSTLVDEVIIQLKEFGQLPPAAFVVSVGGGGLLCGVLEGVERHASSSSSSSLLHSTTIVAAETTGAACFGQAWRLDPPTPVRLDAITSVATSLGALEVTPVAIERARAHIAQGGTLLSTLCSDAQAVAACLALARDHCILVEPACGAALAVLYSDELRHEFLASLGDQNDGPIVIEVCGGSGVNIDLLTQWKKEFGL